MAETNKNISGIFDLLFLLLSARKKGSQSVNPTIELPPWGNYLLRLGRQLANIPPVDFGVPSPRIALSVPSGRFTYWFLTAGALGLDIFPTPRPVAGQRVATWLNSRMQDVDLEETRPGFWRLAPTTQVIAENWPAIQVPEDTPVDRRSAKPPRDYRQALSLLQGRSTDWHVWFAAKCLRPVVIVGTGREHIQQQRQLLLEQVPHWFSPEVAALLDEDSTSTSNPERTLFHPYMVFDAGVGDDRPWLRAMLPRLVITTSWSSLDRMHPALFSRAPQIIITNRRVRSETAASIELAELSRYEGLEHIVDDGRPDSIGVTVFAATAQGDAGVEMEDLL